MVRATVLHELLHLVFYFFVSHRFHEDEEELVHAIANGLFSTISDASGFWKWLIGGNDGT